MLERNVKPAPTWVESDFMFAWRCLLPSHGSATFGMFGFNDAARSFWRTAMSPQKLVPSGKSGEICVINADHFKKILVGVDQELRSAKTICIVGGGLNVFRWKRLIRDSHANCREYALLPSRNPRVLVPLSTRRHVLAGLGIHRPGRSGTRAAIYLARFFAWMGSYSLLRGRVLLIATRHPIAESIEITDPVPSMESEFRAHDYALYFGAPNDNRKIAALPLNKGKPTTILKIAKSPAGRNSILAESAALKELETTSIARYVPKRIAVTDADMGATLCQEYRTRRYIRKRIFVGEIIRFLVGLSEVSRHWLSLRNVLDTMHERGNIANSINTTEHLGLVYEILETEVKKGVTVCQHRSHGDFAPWNCVWTRAGLFVFDWEESQRSEVALTDAFYYAMAPLIHVGHRPNPTRILRKALEFSSRVASAAGLKGLDVKVHFAIFALQRIGRDPIYSSLLRALADSYI